MTCFTTRLFFFRGVAVVVVAAFLGIPVCEHFVHFPNLRYFVCAGCLFLMLFIDFIKHLPSTLTTLAWTVTVLSFQPAHYTTLMNPPVMVSGNAFGCSHWHIKHFAMGPKFACISDFLPDNKQHGMFFWLFMDDRFALVPMRRLRPSPGSYILL